ncbi:hypothetical protein OEZ86_011746 [Tetradesmus obliquus]|nr:hypothetical protein OEZ86_011746 [Tetradesmus obliquus]
MLLGPNLCAAGHAAMKRQFKALAVVVADAGRNWVTFNTANKHHGGSACFVQLAMQLHQGQDGDKGTVLLHTEDLTVAGMAAGRGCNVYLLAAGSSLSVAQVQELMQQCLPGAVLGNC